VARRGSIVDPRAYQLRSLAGDLDKVALHVEAEHGGDEVERVALCVAPEAVREPPA
jgi:hypothetical protein